MSFGETTIEDVARLAGVSIATVSRTLHHPNLVKSETRSRVQIVVQNTGYIQNIAAQNLRRQKTGMILILVSNVRDPAFAEFLTGLEERATDRGYTIVLGFTGGSAEREEFFTGFVRQKRADGLILINGNLPAGLADYYRQDVDTPPIITIREKTPEEWLTQVITDDIAGAEMAVEHLIALGHSKIAHIKGPGHNILARERLRGYLQALVKKNLLTERQLILEGDFTVEAGRKAAKIIDRSERKPSAVFCANDAMAQGLISELDRLGWRLPEQLSIVGFDNLETSAVMQPALTSIHIPHYEMGRLAMDRLLDLLDGEILAEPGHIHCPFQLIKRASSVHFQAK